MKIKPMTEEELNSVSREIVIKMYLKLADSFDVMSRQMDQMIEQNRALTVSIEKLQEQVAILTQHRFGRRTEKTSEIPSEQMTIADLL